MERSSTRRPRASAAPAPEPKPPPPLRMELVPTEIPFRVVKTAATKPAPMPATEDSSQVATPGPDSAFLDVESRRRLDDLVELLDPRSADVVRSRYGLVDGRQEKLADIGARHGVSAERVRQLEREALATLRKLADPDLAA